jgi:hypothetical protein
LLRVGPDALSVEAMDTPRMEGTLSYVDVGDGSRKLLRLII